MTEAPRDNVELMCDISDLVAHFDLEAGIDELLQRIVATVARHTQADVCAVYLYESALNELVLRAAHGMNPAWVGQLRFRIDEGLIGASLRQMRAICVGKPGDHKPHPPIPGLTAKSHPSLLAVPIQRKMNPAGVVVVQDSRPEYFTSRDVQAMRIIAAQLAGAIENAHLMMRLRGAPENGSGWVPEVLYPVDTTLETGTHQIPGRRASGFMGMGLSTRMGHYLSQNPAKYLCPLDLTEEDFDKAIAETERQLRELQARLEEKLQDAASMIFDAHILILRDDAFSGEIRRNIRSGKNPWTAVLDEVRRYVEMFRNSPNPTLREKVFDVEDLGHRLLYNLAPPSFEITQPDYTGQIVIAEDLLPSEILKLASEQVAGLILLSGGQHSHVAILANALQIPLVMASDRRLLDLPERTPILLDGKDGRIIIRPAQETIQAMRESRRALAGSDHAAEADSSETRTRDGTSIRLAANLNLLHELDAARRVKAEGIGLYRTEFPFIVRSLLPTEEEQYQSYSEILVRLEGRPVVFRTLDIGADKALSYFPMCHGNNPLLGLRALRFTLRNPEIFKQQLRAILRAAHGHPEARIMFPMVASLDEFMGAKQITLECAAELEREGIPHRLPAFGTMIELPSAVLIADELAAAADFLSIGSNDLIQYMLAVDRTNDEVAAWFSPHHPAILRSLNRVARAAEQAGKPVSLCGNLATHARMLPFLLGIGLRSFSLDPLQIPAVRRHIANIDLPRATALASRLLELGQTEEISEALDAFATSG